MFSIAIIQVMNTVAGRVLGGSSSVNWMLYVRGHRHDYDSWQSMGCSGWGWSGVEKYFKKMENYSCLHKGKMLTKICIYIQSY